MLTPEGVLFFFVLLLLAALMEPIANQHKIPVSVVLVLLGFIGSEITTGVFGIDTGIRWDNFQLIIFHIFIPIIIFSAALKLNIQSIWQNAIPIFFIAFPFMWISTAITATILYFGIGHATGFPWMVALLTGALLAATAPSAIISVLKRQPVPEKLLILLDGEGLFNDVGAIILFMLLISLTLAGSDNIDPQTIASNFGIALFGGVLVGLISGALAGLFLKLLPDPHLKTLITLLSAYGVYIIADDFLHVSAVIAVLTAGLVIRQTGEWFNVSSDFTDRFWGFAEHITDSLIFLLAGVTITLSMFSNQWKAMLIGIVAVLIARGTLFFMLMPLLGLFSRACKMPLKHQAVLTWGGVRGTVTLALALSLPLELDAWYTVQSIAYGVVIFALFIQTTTMGALIRKLDLSWKNPPVI